MSYRDKWVARKETSNLIGCRKKKLQIGNIINLSIIHNLEEQCHVNCKIIAYIIVYVHFIPIIFGTL